MLTSTIGLGLSTTEMLIAYAIKAPTPHKSPPWRFETDGHSRVRVLADRSRPLLVGAPAGRELVISCGAAIESFVVAARAFGFEADVSLVPDPRQPDALAVVTIAPGDWPSDEESLLFDAIESGRTVRAPFTTDPVEHSIVAELAAAAACRGAAFIRVDAAATRAAIRVLVGEADRRQCVDPAWRGALVQQAPVLGILATAGDSTRDWLLAGRALDRVLLTAARHHLQAGFLNQPCHVPELREQVRGLILEVGYPQAILRVGRPVQPVWQTSGRGFSDRLRTEPRCAPLLQ
jgi:hypothetical protein